ncbi:MAG: sigma-70 family RNA polymerase sigma factor [Bryobacteraceae bacterium]|nr:sigma-70 family RNA polymerase sigma factor [Bryobacteraceae bacterium]
MSGDVDSAVGLQVTQLLVEWKSGNKQAADLLIPVLYQELRKQANRYLSNESSAATLQPTALVHETYLRLVAQKLPDWESRSHFIGVAAHLMRQILVDHARSKHAAKRGSGEVPVPIDEALSFAAERSREVVDLDDALKALAEVDEQKAQIIEMRFFGGMSTEETARALGLTVFKLRNNERLAQAWLHRHMTGKTPVS